VSFLLSTIFKLPCFSAEISLRILICRRSLCIYIVSPSIPHTSYRY